MNRSKQLNLDEDIESWENYVNKVTCSRPLSLELIQKSLEAIGDQEASNDRFLRFFDGVVKETLDDTPNY